jgi:adenine-specific DNA-methyltransferase
MNYIGSKLSLLDFLEENIERTAGKDTNRVFCDLFAGTGSVGLHFKRKGYRVIANDIQYYSYVINRNIIGNHKELEFTGLEREFPELKSKNFSDKKIFVCQYLNSLDGKEGYIFKNYCPNFNNERQYFSVANGKKCDAVREQIETWKNSGKINEDEYFYLLSILLEQIDKVANTASVYGAYLKKFKKSALKNFEFAPAPVYINDNEHLVYNEDVNKLIKEIKTDILYLDPPYNARQYATNYHVLETIAKYDSPEIKGKTGLRNYERQKSKYCSKACVKSEFYNLIKNAVAKYIFLSYNNEGLLSLGDIKEIMGSRGEYGFFTREYNRFKADNSREYSANKTVEYLHYCRVS